MRGTRRPPRCAPCSRPLACQPMRAQASGQGTRDGRPSRHETDVLLLVRRFVPGFSSTSKFLEHCSAAARMTDGGGGKRWQHNLCATLHTGPRPGSKGAARARAAKARGRAQRSQPWWYAVSAKLPRVAMPNCVCTRSRQVSWHRPAQQRSSAVLIQRAPPVHSRARTRCELSTNTHM